MTEVGGGGALVVDGFGDTVVVGVVGGAEFEEDVGAGLEEDVGAGFEVTGGADEVDTEGAVDVGAGDVEDVGRGFLVGFRIGAAVLRSTDIPEAGSAGTMTVGMSTWGRRTFGPGEAEVNADVESDVLDGPAVDVVS